MPRYIKKMKVVEVALVDHPAVPGAKFLLFKAADGGPDGAGGESEEVKKSKIRELLDGAVTVLKRVGEYMREPETKTVIDYDNHEEQDMIDEARFKAVEDGLEAVRKTLEERADKAEEEEVKKEEKAEEEEAASKQADKEDNSLQEAVKELKAQDGEFIEAFDKLSDELAAINARLDKAVSKSSVTTKDDEKKKGQGIFAGHFS